MFNGDGISVMEVSIIPETLRILNGHPGFRSLPEIAISVHCNKAAWGHMSELCGFSVGTFGSEKYLTTSEFKKELIMFTLMSV